VKPAVAAGLLIVTSTISARAEPILLRMATVAPPGTAWAREGMAYERDIEALTHGQVKSKWYLGGIAGDEMEMLDRLRREQLDGVASGGMLCMKLAPSMRVLRIVGLFQSRAESAYVSGRLKDTLDKEFLQAGFVNLGEVGVGPDILISRQPIRTMAELSRARLWIWDIDDVYQQELPSMGLSVVPRPVQGAFAAFEQHQLDGFLAVPTAALAFQWSTEARYFMDLRASFLRGCLLMTSRSYDALPVEGQHAVMMSAARTIARLEELGKAQDEALLGGLFARQGLTPVPVNDQVRAEFFEAARTMRDRLRDALVPPALLQRVLGMLADYRAEHRMSAAQQ
jgi:TRAP-type C4-dicarboxylate transport system substrate-binding protein